MPDKERFNFSLITIAEDNAPIVVEKRGREWVEIGEDNNYFNYLEGLYLNSALNKALIDGISRRIYGEGLATDEVNDVVAFAKAKQLLNKNIVTKFILDYYLNGNSYLLLRTNKVGGVTEIEFMPCNTIRPEKMNDDGVIEGYWYSADWSDIRKQKYIPERYDAYDPENERAGEFIFPLKQYCPSHDYFGVPTWTGGAKWAECDIEVADYHLTNTKSGFSAATIVQFNNGIPTPQEREMIERRFEEKFQGSKAKKVMFIYNDSRDVAAEVSHAPIPEADKQYEYLSEEIRKNLMLSHRITSPMLLGIRQETGLGNNADEIRVADELFQRITIKPLQNEVIEYFNTVLQAAGISVKIYFKPLTTLANPKPTTNLSRVNLSQEDDGFKVLTDEDQHFILDYLEDKGESEEDLIDEGFELVDEQELQGDDELQVDEGEKLSKVELQSAWGLTPDNLSKYDVKAPNGEGVWLVRYQYALSDTLTGQPPIIETSRLFCKKMIDSAQSGNRVYKREVLEGLRNTEFGSYNIFWYKGSYNCRHVWKRKLYFKSFANDRTLPVGNVPYVARRVNDKRATTINRKPSR